MSSPACWTSTASTYEGLYGMEETATDITLALLPSVERAAALVPEAWVEDKRISVAVHYRAAPDPPAARATLIAALEPIAAAAGTGADGGEDGAGARARRTGR